MVELRGPLGDSIESELSSSVSGSLLVRLLSTSSSSLLSVLLLLLSSLSDSESAGAVKAPLEIAQPTDAIYIANEEINSMP